MSKSFILDKCYVNAGAKFPEKHFSGAKKLSRLNYKIKQIVFFNEVPGSKLNYVGT
ncbi:hypothetical protein DSM106972_032410 [Dulcicalothrix desertica PCC 7102]|uniref:Uncharacterized protein n=1 Tax=Dulcicalothrix desertica PCC 7102 TaxID=232991 RepID=A0A3S1CF05_9CYAN|nr:hypothetical protein DSM106972_032410 [Dulcicalothrix desertica PCC 7102]